MAKIIIQKGNLGRDAELKKTRNGEDVLSFPVGASQGYGDSKKTNWYRCTIFGKRAVALAPYLVKGATVGVVGEFETDEYEGKTQFKIIVDPNGLELLSRADNAPKPMSQHNIAKGNGYQPDEDLEDEVPF